MKAQSHVERAFDAVDANLAVALGGVTVSAGEECARIEDRQVELGSAAEVADVHVAAESAGRTRANFAIDRGSDAHDSAEGAQRNDCGRQRASLASGQVPVEKVGFAEALLEEAKAFGDGGVAPAMMARIEDVDLKNVAGLGSADENRSGERVNAVAVDGKQVGERGAAFDLAAAGLDALEVNSVAGSDLEARRQSAVPAGMGGLGNQRMLGHVT